MPEYRETNTYFVSVHFYTQSVLPQITTLMTCTSTSSAELNPCCVNTGRTLKHLVLSKNFTIFQRFTQILFYELTVDIIKDAYWINADIQVTN